MEPYTPTFTRDVRSYPTYNPGTMTLNTGSSYAVYNPMYFPSEETARWVADVFEAAEVWSEPFTLSGYWVTVGPVPDGWRPGIPPLPAPPPNWFVKVEGMRIHAGQLAWYFSVRPEGSDPNDPDAGWWNASDPDSLRMESGKKQADLLIKNSLAAGGATAV